MRPLSALLVGLMAAALAPVGTRVAPASAQVAPSAPDRPALIMTFNIHHGVGPDGRLDLHRIAEVVRNAGPAIVGLQEVDRHWAERSDFVDQASWLARELKMHVVYGANLDLDPPEPDAPRRQYGTAILTDHPILEWDNTFLPRFEGHEQRGLLRALVNVRGVPLEVYNTHLQHNDAAEREAQTEAIQDLIGIPRHSVALIGDLNATPATPEIATLMETLVDAWVEAGVGDGYTFSSQNPDRRIDYVMKSNDVVARSAAVITSEASDHLPVVAELYLPGAKMGVGRD